MKRYLLYLLFTVFCSFSHYAFCAEEPSKMTQWEQENASREAQEEEKFSALWYKTFIVLAVLIAVLFLSTWATKHYSRFKIAQNGREAHIQVLEKRVISPKSVVYLLQIEGQKIAISESANGIVLLTNLPHPPQT